jgi:hypothetical protein
MEWSISSLAFQSGETLFPQREMTEITHWPTVEQRAKDALQQQRAAGQEQAGHPEW